jgi:hypothetical protein
MLIKKHVFEKFESPIQINTDKYDRYLQSLQISELNAFLWINTSWASAVSTKVNDRLQLLAKIFLKCLPGFS